MNLMKYVAIDIETTGLDPERHQILEIGAVVETDWRTPVEQLPTFQCYCHHGEIRGDAYALWMNANAILQTASAPDLNANLIDLSGFLEEQLGPGSVTVAGKNFASFDLQFLRRNDGWKLIRHKHRIIDVGNLFWNPLKDTCLPDLSECAVRAGVQLHDLHTAVGDCRSVIECVRAWRAKGGAA